MRASDRLISKAHDYEVLAASHSEREALVRSRSAGVASLVAEQEPAALALAHRLARALDDELAALALDADERRLLLAQLEDAETHALAELRGTAL